MKRGQAGNIATLISLIALFLLVYILLLPQEARDELLQREDGMPTYMLEDGEVLFSKDVGKVSPLKQATGTIHTISGVNLFSDFESEIVTLANDIMIDKGLLSENSQNLIFYLEYPRDVKKAELYLLTKKAVGNLIITLNGYDIFNSPIRSNSQRLLELPLGYLDETNTLELKSSSGGVFGSNTHEFKSVKLRKEVEVKNKVSKRVISVPASELKDLENALLSFSVYCARDEKEILNINLNGNLIYSDVPFCNLRIAEIEVDSEFVIGGSNNLVFESEGDYTLEDVEWESFLGSEKEREYAFTISDDDYKDARLGIKDVFVVFDFALSDDRKIMDFYVNDEEIEIDTRDSSYLMVISDYLEKGGNLIRLKPRNSFEIIEMRVEIE